jgi:hypothetical protein
MREILRVGVLLRSVYVPAWVNLAMEKIHSCEGAEIALVVIEGPVESNRSRKKIPYLPHIYLKADRKLFHPILDANSMVDSHAFINQFPTIHTLLVTSGKDPEYPADTLEQIVDYHLDVLVSFNLPAMKGKIYESTRMGIWYYKWNDPLYEGDYLPGFWEVFSNQPVTAWGLYQKTTDQVPEKVIYQSISATDPLSVRLNCNRILWKGASFIPRKLKEVQRMGVDAYLAAVTGEDQLSTSQPYLNNKTIPANWEFCRLLSDYLFRFFVNRFNKLLFHTQWLLLFDFEEKPFFQSAPNHQPMPAIDSRLSKFKSLAPPRSNFWSDPFIVYREGGYYLFFEDFSYKKKKAHISVLVLDQTGHITGPQKVVDRPYHLSYPFVFEWQNDLYMLPEMAAHHAIEVYRCTEFPLKWEYDRTLVNHVNALDTTLYEYQGRWWMFLNQKENEGASSWDELYLYYADNPLSTNWTPHPKNPIVSDVRTARPAGCIFEADGKVIRPSQDSSLGYGYGVNLNRILVMNEKDYQEEILCKIKPGWSHQIRGVHTYNRVQNLVVIDAKSRRFRYP